MGFKPTVETEDGYQIGDPVGGDTGDTGDGETALGFLDRVKGGEFNPFFQFLTRAGLELAAGKENLGQDIAQAGIAGMGEVERLADRDMAILDREREQRRQDAADAIAQRQLEMEEELLPAKKALLEARASAAGQRISESQAISAADDLLSESFGTDLGSPEDRALLIQLIMEYQDTNIAYQKLLEMKGMPSSFALPGNKDKLLEFMGS